jgi:hypothetical protein
MKKSHAVLLISVFVLLSLFDFITTSYLISSGRGHEGNPIMASLMTLELYTPVKIVLTVLIALLLYEIYHMDAKAFKLSSFSINLLYLLIAYNNLRFLTEG